MKLRCDADNRELIIRVLRDVTGERPVYRGLPDFSWTVAGYTLTRDGFIEAESPEPELMGRLAGLGLCDWPIPGTEPENMDFAYPTEGHSGATLTNLICILSARQQLINRAIGARGAFCISPELTRDVLRHPPVTAAELIRIIYGRETEHRGLELSLDWVTLSGLRQGPPEEARIRRELADIIMAAAKAQRWAKPFTPRVKNQKYAMRSWLNSVGMGGPEHEEARRVLLARLPGRTDRRRLTK